MNPLNIVITGVFSDIGIEVARRVASTASNTLLVTSLKYNPNYEELLSKLPANIIHLKGLDLTLESATNSVSESAKNIFTAPFCWLHSVGDFWYHKSIENTPLDEAISLINSHYVTLFATAKALIPIMKNVKGGRILAFSCNSVRYNYPHMAAFTSAKAAVECLIRCIANEYLEHDILANCLSLPTIATPKVKSSKHEEYHKYYIEVERLVDLVIDSFISMSPLVTGNSISLVKYSPYFYHHGYFHRNRNTKIENKRERTNIL